MDHGVIKHHERILIGAIVHDLRWRIAGSDVIEPENIRPRAAIAMIARAEMQRVIAFAAIEKVHPGLIQTGDAAKQTVIPVISVNKVRSAATKEEIGARAALQVIIAMAAAQRICPLAAGQAVIAAPRQQKVTPGIAAKGIIPRATGNAVIARFAAQIIRPGRAGQTVAALAPTQPVIAQAANNRIITAATAEKVISGRTGNMVIATIPRQHIIGTAARQRDSGIRRWRRVIRLRHPGIRVVEQGNVPLVAIALSLRRIIGKGLFIRPVARDHGIDEKARHDRPQQTKQP
jgi:hypothetical protein